MAQPYRRTKGRSLPAAVTIGALRMLNTYESTGLFEGRQSRLDDLILEHLAVEQELRKLDAWEETLCRMVAEGYEQQEIAAELSCSPDTVRRKLRQVRWSLLGVA